MKAQTKALVASVVVIALALSAVSGITYSWFNDSDDAKIEVTAGKVDVALDNFTSAYYSNNALQTDGFFNGGSATIDSSTNTVTITNMSDMDALEIGFDIVNRSTIKTVYRVSTTVSGGLADYLTSTFTVDGNSYEDVTPWTAANAVADGASENIAATLKVLLDSNNQANGITGTTTVSIKVEAYQANTPGENLPAYTVTKTVTAGETISQTFNNGNTSVSSVGVSIAEAAAGEYTIGSITSSENSSYTVMVDSGSAQTVISGISVSTSTAGVDLSNKAGVLTFVLNESLISDGKLASGYSIVHQKSTGATETVSLGTAAESAEAVSADKNYFIDTNSNTLTLYVTGFSSYLVVVDADASITTGGTTKYYEKMKDAMDGAADNSTIKLLRDASIVDGTNKYELKKALTIDLNQNELTIYRIFVGYNGNANNASGDTSGASLTIQNGKLKTTVDGASTSAIPVGTGCSVKLDGVTFDASKATGLYPRGVAASVEVLNSTITAAAYGVGTNASNTQNGGVSINIQKSSITAKTTVLFNVAGTLDITDSTLTGTTQCLIVRAGTATVSETTFNFTGTSSGADRTSWGSGNDVAEAAIVVGNLGTGYGTADAVLTLTDCTFSQENCMVILRHDGGNGHSATIKMQNVSKHDLDLYDYELQGNSVGGTEFSFTLPSTED